MKFQFLDNIITTDNHVLTVMRTANGKTFITSQMAEELYANRQIAQIEVEEDGETFFVPIEYQD